MGQGQYFIDFCGVIFSSSSRSFSAYTAVQVVDIFASCGRKIPDQPLRILIKALPELALAAGILALQAQYPNWIFYFLSVIKYLNRVSNPDVTVPRTFTPPEH